jgi:shikimate dehydrogenase
MDIGGSTIVTGIFGDPVEHSLSPAMHNAAYRALGLDRAYVAFHVKPENLRDAIRAIPALRIFAVNLTLPHKERALRMIDGLSGEARLLGAVNCIVNRRDGLYGDNTDARGLEKDLGELAIGVRRRTILIIGAGGGAAAAVMACIRLGARRIAIANRTRERAMRLARRFAGRAGRTITVQGLEAMTDRALLSEAALVINATSIGLGGARLPELAYEATPADCFFYDLFYGAQRTEFLQRAREANRRYADGAGMLLRQAVLAFKLFNRVAPPAGVMRRALMEGLGRALP